MGDILDNPWPLLHRLNFNFGPWDDGFDMSLVMGDLHMVDEDGSIGETVTEADLTAFIAYYGGDTDNAPTDSPVCEWWAMCDRQSAFLRSHPVLRWVPICEGCNEKVARLGG